MKTSNRQLGYLLVSMIITLFMVASIAVLLTQRSSISANTASRELETIRAEYVAQAGMQHALWRTQNNACMGDVTIPATTLGTDNYTAAITGAASGTSFTLNADQDAWIRSDDIDRNNGTGGSNHVKFDNGNVEQVLTRFDTSSLPSNAQVNSATAWFHLKAAKDHPEGRITVHEITSDWDEDGVTWESFDGAYRAGAVAVIPAQDAGDTWVALNITGLVQAWVNGQPNNGILFDSIADGLHTEYTAREDGTSPPRLEVTIGGGQASAVVVESVGTLQSGVTRTQQRTPVTAYQPATVFEVSSGEGSGQDTMMKQDSQSNNLGANDSLWVQDTSGGNGDHSLLQFDLSGLPLGARIVSAALSLHQHFAGSPGGTVSAHRVTREWDEGSNDNSPGDGVTWITYDWFRFWSDAGGDYDPQPSAITEIPSSAVGRFEWDLTSLVDGWVHGDYPNHGLILVPHATGTDLGFKSSDDLDTRLHPRLTVSYACECGTSCLAPQGTGRIALIGDDWTPDPDDQLKIQIIESWGYDVDFYQDRDSGGINWSNYDLAYVSETSIAGDVNASLVNLSIGVINEEPNLYDNLQLASGDTEHVGSSIDVTDNNHFITSVFPQGSLPIYTGGMEILTANAPLAGGLQTLAEFSGAATLTATAAGAQTIGGTAAGRRVTLPLGQHFAAGFDWKNLNQNGHLLVQRAIAWGIGDDVAAAGDLLMIVGNDGNLTTQESAKRSLLESWGYTVTVIDEDDSQDSFDTALAANDVVFVTEDATSTDVGSKLTAAEIGVVIEEVNLASQLGFGASIDWGSGTELVIDSGHYITAALTSGTTQVLSTTESLATLGGALSSELDVPGRLDGKSAISALDVARYRHNGGGTAGRRVMLPWGGNNMEVGYLTDDGLTIFQRAIEWAAGACSSTVPLLFVVGDTTNLDARDGDLRALLTDWCYSVTLIDDGADQAEFDSAIAAHRVVYVSSSIASTTLADKLASSKAGVVNEHPDMTDYFGFGDSPTATTTFDQFTLTAASQYISKPFEGAGVTLFTASHTLPVVTGTLAPGLQSAAELGTLTWALPMLESGATRWDGLQSAGRRVHHPFGNAPIDDFTADGTTLLKRTIEWAAGYERGLVAHWRLDDASGQIAIDSLGGHDGTLADDPTWITGAVGGGLYFDGNDDIVTAPHDDALSLTTYTVAAWIFARELTDYNCVVSKGVLNAIQWALCTYNDEIVVGGEDGGGAANRALITSGAGLVTNTWYHIAGTFDEATGETKAYLNGALIGNETNSWTPDTNTEDVRIGQTSASGDDWFGILDDIRLYNRVLSDSEIAEIVEAAKPAEAHWKLDETSGTTAVDSIGGHDGDTYNTEWVTGKVNGALRFNSSADAVRVPHTFDLSFTDEITVAAWINKTGFFGYDGAVVKASSGSDINYFLGTWESYPVFGFSTSTDNWQGFYSTSTPLQANTWYHLVATFDNAADQVRIYLDGSLVQEFAAPQEPTTNIGYIFLGRSAIGEYWPGLLDEVRILNRVLDASEVSDLAVGGGSPPIAHWMLDDGTGSTAIDSEGNHDGTLANGPVWVAGQLGDALRFDGSNDRINVPHQSGLNLVATMTLSAWVKPDTLKPYQMVLTKGDNGVYENYWVGLEGNKANFGFVAGGTYYQHTTSGLTLSAGTWHHIAATYDDAANEVKIYVDGVAETFTTPGTPVVNSEKLIIGNSYYSGEGFDGTIDDVRIYNGALSATEIANIASGGGGGGGGGGGCGGPFGDTFDAVNYGGGTANWAGPWQETGETTSPSGGDIRIANDISNYQLLVRDDGQTVWREADLGDADSATLSFDYRRQNLSGSNDYVAVEVSYDGGTSWDELDRFTGTATDSSYLPYSRTLDPNSLSANTRIRFRTPNSGMSNNNMVWFDNLEITCAP